MSTLNLGILAHVDAGKTSLTERLLYAAGVIDQIGSVDHGNTQTDSLALERRRGITIKSAVVSFAVHGVTVNLIDTPGHPDFIAEVERVLSVLDGAVLVVSAVEGVQAQTRVLMRTLRRLGIPTVIFVNKIDRRGATEQLAALADRLSPAIVPLGRTNRIGTRDAGVTECEDGLADVLTRHDDPLLAAYVENDTLSAHEVRAALVRQTRAARVHPVYFGSAITGAGVDQLIRGVTELLPSGDGDTDGPASGTVFKVERGPAGEKVAYVRMFAGSVATREKLRTGKVTAIGVFDNGSVAQRDVVRAGEIAKVWGLGDVRIGDTIGTARHGRSHHFAPPSLETVVVPRPSDRGALHSALTQLAEQDPLIDLRHDEVRGETSVSLYGEVQKEVIQATLAEEFGLAVTFRETTTLCVERPAGTGAAVELIAKDPNPFLATVGLRVAPGPVGSGVDFRLGVELGSMPYAFFRAVEETVTETFREGLHGWAVTDAVVTMTHSGYYARQSHSHGTFDKSMSSTAGDFRNLTPLVLMDALRRAGTVVLEPMHRFRLEVPEDTVGTIAPLLARLRAVTLASTAHRSTTVLEGDIPAARVHELERRLPGATRGEAVLESAFHHYEPVRQAVPDRPRTDLNPLNRKEYLLHVQRRV